MLQFTRKVEYGLAIVSYMMRDEADTLHSARTIAEAVHIPFDMVTKCLQRMAKSGLCRAVQGKNGGYALACDPTSLSMGKFLQLFSEPVAIVECLGSNDQVCSQQNTCSLIAPMQRLNARFLALLNSMTLSDFFGDLQNQPLPNCGSKQETTTAQQADQA